MATRSCVLLAARITGPTSIAARSRFGSRSDRIEFTILTGDQIIGKREARHRLEAPRPCVEVGPVGDLKPALRHEHHAAPAADIGNRAIIADKEWLVFDCLVDKGKRGFRTRA